MKKSQALLSALILIGTLTFSLAPAFAEEYPHGARPDAHRDWDDRNDRDDWRDNWRDRGDRDDRDRDGWNNASRYDYDQHRIIAYHPAPASYERIYLIGDVLPNWTLWTTPSPYWTARLPDHPRGTRYVQKGNYIYLINMHSGRILRAGRIL